MGTIMMQCPRTLREVSVGIETDRDSFEAMPSVQSKMTCPACGAVHVWSKDWAWLDPITVSAEEIERQPASIDASPIGRSSSASGTP